jgi:hypothetical protein
VLADVSAVLEMERMQLIYAMHKEIERHAVAIQEGQRNSRPNKSTRSTFECVAQRQQIGAV